MKSFLTLIYIKLFSKSSFLRLNNFILKLALNARGYDNYKNNDIGGENFFLSSILPKSNPKICIDIGAAEGNYTKKLLQFTNSKVISFEPVLMQFEKLKENTKNFGERSIIVNKGIGEKSDKLYIHFDPNNLNKASFSEEIKRVPYVDNNQKSEINVISLDYYLNENNIDSLDFIKIDTEGYELEVLKGAMRSIEKYKPKYIQIEFNWHQLFRNTSINYFFDLLPPTYDLYQLIPNGWEKRDPKDPITNIFLYSNFIFVNRDIF